MPEKIPVLSRDEILTLGKKPTNMAIAQLWNLFFDEPISGWDLDFSVSRNWVRLHSIQRKLVLAEGWHNPEGEVQYCLKYLSERKSAPWGFWAETVIKMCILGTGIAAMTADGTLDKRAKTDIACICGDFSGILAGLYLKRMGFPVEKLVCCCNENNSVWEMIHLGTMRTDGVCVPTQTPQADAVMPEGLEHMLWLLGGSRGAMDCVKQAYIGGSYTPSEELLKMLQREIYVSVVSDSRMRFTLAGVFQTSRCLISPYDAMCCAGVQDYRAKVGDSRICLVLSQRDPILDVKILASVLGVSEKEIEAYWRR